MSKYKGLNRIIEDIKTMSYPDRYGTSILIFCILIIILFAACSYFQLKQEFQPIKDNWNVRRCDANVIPLAGIINAPEEESVIGYTAKNFNYCLNNMVKPLAKRAMQPFDMLMAGMLKIFNMIAARINAIRNMVKNIRDRLGLIVKDIYSRLVAVVVPIQQIIMSSKDMFSKLKGIFQVAVNFVVGAILTLKAFLLFIAAMAKNIMIIMAIIMAAAIAVIAACSFFCPWMLPSAITVLGFYTAIYVVVIVIMVLLLLTIKEVTGTTGSVTLFGAPKCFGENTLVLLKDQSIKAMRDVKIGDVLIDGGVVTSTFKLTSDQETMYMINGIIVSGSHSIRHNNQWIKVSSHPDSQKIIDYDKPYLYCINTSTKCIVIDKMIFIDWDEIYDHVEKKLRSVYEDKYNGGKEDSLDFVNKYFSGGFDGKTIISMNGNHTSKYIEDVQVGDILQNNVEVYGIVEIDANKIENKDNIIGANNSQGCLGGKFSENKLYHLLTKSRNFFVDNRKVAHYNNYVDRTF